MRAVLYTLGAVILVGAIIPIFADIHIYSVVTTVLIWIMFGHAWNILGGFTGQISFGHAMFLAIGAYSAMIITNHLQLDMFLTLILGGLFAGLFSLPIGLLIFRLRGPYFGLGTLAIAEIIHIVGRNWKSVTNGGEGMMLLSVPKFLGIQISSKDEYFYLALILTAAVSLFCYFLMKSKTGYMFIAVRESQESAEAIGINTTLVKSKAFFISAFLAGFTGAFYGLYNKFIDPDMTLTVSMSVEIIFVTVLGGIGTILGPVIGASILITLQEWLKDMDVLQAFPSLYLLIYGLVIMFVIVYLPGGIVDGINQLKERLSKRRRRDIEYTQSG